jgi:hypothetical protein
MTKKPVAEKHVCLPAMWKPFVAKHYLKNLQGYVTSNVRTIGAQYVSECQSQCHKTAEMIDK